MAQHFPVKIISPPLVQSPPFGNSNDHEPSNSASSSSSDSSLMPSSSLSSASSPSSSSSSFSPPDDSSSSCQDKSSSSPSTSSTSIETSLLNLPYSPPTLNLKTGSVHNHEKSLGDRRPTQACCSALKSSLFDPSSQYGSCMNRKMNPHADDNLVSNEYSACGFLKQCESNGSSKFPGPPRLTTTGSIFRRIGESTDFCKTSNTPYQVTQLKAYNEFLGTTGHYDSTFKEALELLQRDDSLSSDPDHHTSSLSSSSSSHSVMTRLFSSCDDEVHTSLSPPLYHMSVTKASLPREPTLLDHSYAFNPLTPFAEIAAAAAEAPDLWCGQMRSNQEYSSYCKAEALKGIAEQNGEENKASSTMSHLSSNSIPSDRMIQTSRGVAVLLSDTQQPQLQSSTMKKVANDNRKFKRWTRQEDELLKEAVSLETSRASVSGMKTISWKRIAQEYFLGSRNEAQCKGRWKKALDPSIFREPFSQSEDDIILEGRQQGKTFGDIAKMLSGRISEQVRDRFLNCIDPSLHTKKKVPWSDEEKQTLYEAQKRMGNKWTVIAKLLPGRSESCVKNQWHSAKMASRRAMRRLATAKKYKHLPPPFNIGSNSETDDELGQKYEVSSFVAEDSSFVAEDSSLRAEV